MHKRFDYKSNILYTCRSVTRCWNKRQPNINTVIVTQLCQALTDLILQMPGWTGAVADLLAMLGQKNTTTLLSAAAVTQFLQLRMCVCEGNGKKTRDKTFR